MRVVVIVQARVGSTRLPGKVLRTLGGCPMLERLIRRAGRARRPEAVIVATTDLAADDPVAALAERAGCGVHRGSEADVLDRFYRAAIAAKADVIVRLTGDCPLVDPALVDAIVDRLLDEPGPADYASNTLEPRTFPRGLDVEAVTLDALAHAWREDRDPASREHVTPFVYRHPDRFILRRVAAPYDCSAHRWTVDTPEDFALLRQLIAHLPSDDAPWETVLALAEAHPEWSTINAAVRQKPH